MFASDAHSMKHRTWNVIHKRMIMPTPATRSKTHISCFDDTVLSRPKAGLARTVMSLDGNKDKDTSPISP